MLHILDVIATILHIAIGGWEGEHVLGDVKADVERGDYAGAHAKWSAFAIQEMAGSDPNVALAGLIQKLLDLLKEERDKQSHAQADASPYVAGDSLSEDGKWRWDTNTQQWVAHEPQYTPPQHTEPQYTPPQHTEPQYTPPQHAQPQYTPPQHAQPQYTPPQYGEPQYTPPQHTPPQYGEPQYSPPQYGEPQYTPPQYTEPQYTPPQYTEPQYTPPQYVADTMPPPQYTEPQYVADTMPQPQYAEPQYVESDSDDG